MSAATRYPVKAAADIAADQSERQALRAAKAAMQEIIDGKDARLAAIDATTTVPLLRAQVKDLARVTVDLAREIKRLCRVGGGADRA